MEVAISDAKRRLSNVLDCQAIKWLGSQIRRTDDDVSDAHKLACVRELGSKLAAERQADNYIFAQHLAKKRVNAILDELAAKRRDREDAKRAEREGSAGVTIVPADSDQWLAEAMRPSSGPEAFL
jgi:hypothetical protein